MRDGAFVASRAGLPGLRGICITVHRVRSALIARELVVTGSRGILLSASGPLSAFRPEIEPATLRRAAGIARIRAIGGYRVAARVKRRSAGEIARRARCKVIIEMFDAEFTTLSRPLARTCHYASADVSLGALRAAGLSSGF